MSICERLFELMGTQRGRQEQLAAYIGVKPTTITNWKQRNSDPPAKLLIPICEFLGCSLNYLLTGEEKEDADAIQGISDDALKVARLWDELDVPGKAIILGELYRRAEALAAPDDGWLTVARGKITHLVPWPRPRR